MSGLPAFVSDARISLNPWAFVAIGVISVLLAVSCIRYLPPRPRIDAPTVFPELDTKSQAKRYSEDSKAAVQAAYRLLQQGQAMVRLIVADGSEVVMMNHCYLKELRSLPDTAISAETAVNNSLVSGYSHIKVVDAVGQNAIRSDLTPGLPRLMPVIASEAHSALRSFFPCESEDWVRITAFQSVLRSITQVSARLFVGGDLCRDEAWLSVASKATISAFDTAYAMKQWPAWLRPITCHYTPEYRALMQARKEGIEILKKHTATASQKNGERKEKEDYIVTWISNKRPQWTENFAAQADLQLELSVAAIHTTTMAMTHLLYDLAANPKYISILRAEIKEALAASNNQYNKDCIVRMSKVDSFMMESQRLHPPGLTTFQRYVLEDVILADGTRLPKGATMAIDSSARNFDPAIWENPDQFDGLRFFKLREQSQNKANHQFVASNPDNLVWGQGRHACPGRFFAANEIKTIFAMFILDFDVSFPEGATRPDDVVNGNFITPSNTAEILIRRAQV